MSSFAPSASKPHDKVAKREQNPHYSHYNGLKHLLTGPQIEVEQKFGQRISIASMHRMIMTSNHAKVVDISDDERRFFVCDVSDKRRDDHVYFAPLWRAANGEDEATLAAFMHDLMTHDIAKWRPEEGARNAVARHLARQNLISLLRGRANVGYGNKVTR